MLARLRTWWQLRTGEEDTPFDGDVPAWLTSMMVNMVVLLALAFATIYQPPDNFLTLTTSTAVEEEPELDTPDDFYFSEQTEEQVGANSAMGSEMALALAPVVADLSAVPAPVEPENQSEVGDIPVQQDIVVATGPNFSENLVVRGASGVGTTGAAGAIDRITHEILLSLEERKTLVVWFFDQSGSLESQRAEILTRFERVYHELGVIEASENPAFKRHDSKPLLSAAVAFGQKISLLTPKPTDDVKELMKLIAEIPIDKTGVEQTFTSIYQAADKFKEYRVKEPRRNVMFVVFTDEVGDDEQGLDATVGICRKFEIPVYVVGVPAPFGRKDVEIKWVDPDPQFSQEPQWVPVRQGPESFLPEVVRLGFTGDKQADLPIDSGFGPYSLTRLCYETGGIYFTVHPNRNAQRRVDKGQTASMSAHIEYFFDPSVMRDYRPDYVSLKEYDRLIKSNNARQALVQAAQFSHVTPMESPTTHFPKVSEADLANKLSMAQRQAAVLEPKINQVYEVLKQGEPDRPKLTQPRWQAGYDLAMGRVLAVKVRTEAYNAMLAKAKQGMKFENPKNDTWDLQPADEISVGSALEKQAKQAKEYLQRVVDEHPGTPWAFFASRELAVPVGWKWVEAYTGVNEPRMGDGGGNAPPPQDDKLRMLDKGPPKRPAPRL